MKDSIINNDAEINPLVSIIVITYNSSKYVLETLESAKAQTYQNIELIISDDCSQDDTVAVCKEWLEENKGRFVSTELITAPENTGIPKNCNRGLHASKGEWVKPIAGDDALYKDCVKKNIEFVTKNIDCYFCFSKQVSYRDTFDEKNRILEENKFRIEEFYTKFSQQKIENQLQIVARTNTLPGPATFINRQKLIAIGGYDESYRFLEDWPTWYEWLLYGNKIYYLSEETVKYRVHGNSITNEDRNSFYTLKSIKVKKEKFQEQHSSYEKILLRIENAYYLYYQNKSQLSFFEKFFRRMWYFFVDISVKHSRTKINKFLSL